MSHLLVRLDQPRREVARLGRSQESSVAAMDLQEAFYLVAAVGVAAAEVPTRDVTGTKEMNLVAR